MASELQPLPDQVRSNDITLTELDIREHTGRCIGEGGGVALAGALERNTTLTTLNLEGNGLREGGGVSRAGALERNTTLTTLDLRNNGPRGGCGVALVGALESNTTLMTLNLDRNNLGARSGVLFAGALERNTTLTTLDVAGSVVQDATRQLVRDCYPAVRPRASQWMLRC